MQDTAGEVRTNPKTTFSYGPIHTVMQMLTDQQGLTTTALYGHKM